LNVDYIASVERLPAAGETVLATHFIRRFGGKGANQAIAAARQGASVSLIGCLGDDANGQAYRQRLRAESITTSGISTFQETPTGTALIAVDRNGENSIVVAAGANSKLSAGRVRTCQKWIVAARLLLLQFEMPMPAVIEAVRIANRADIPIVLNPSPFREGFPWGTCRLDTMIVNAREARTVFGSSLRTLRAWQREIERRCIQRVIVTHGSKPTVCISSSGRKEIPALSVKPVDTVGAGDAFAGTYAARYAEGMDVLMASCYANYAGALATLKPGAQEALPPRQATEKAMRNLKGSMRLPLRHKTRNAVE